MTLQTILGHFPRRNKLKEKHKSIIKKWLLSTCFTISNGIGIFLYLRSASLIWAPYGDEGLYGGPGDPIIWVVFAFPYPMLFLLVNFIVFRTVCARAIIYGHWLPLLRLLIILVAWVAAIYYDASRQYNGNRVRIENFSQFTHKR
jgi:hypothetical protein